MGTLYGEDLVFELRSQVLSLSCRVEELERENEGLKCRLSSCSCSKVECLTSSISVNCELTTPNKHHCKEFPVNQTTEPAIDSSFDHSLLCSTNPVKENEAYAFDDLCMGTSAKVSMLDKIEEPGFYLKNIYQYARRCVALKIMYFGQRFYGFASEAQMEPTVESEIFRALEKTKLLVDNKENSQYSRCGRTDKGVSSTGQVIAIYLRSKVKNNGGNNNEKTIFGENCEGEIDYVRVLNRVLPKDIRVIGWCPAPSKFHARFKCLSREYRYLFWRESLDIAAMQKAAKKFVGEHDFRNFCKMDAANVNNYTRKITTFEISSCGKRFDENELCTMTIRGSAFLWHQVRCMVAVLFMIGHGFESPEIIDVLLDIGKTPRKPQYNMAPDLPLILRSCEFEDINFICSSDAGRALHEHLKNEFQTHMLQAAIFQEALSCTSLPETSSMNPGKKPKGHVPLLLRPTEPSFEERRAKLNLKGVLKS
ncbi:tRNA pseudouridine(38/39) synthase isoform X2 [Dioscorea cayenensis subsp. rotundata]|uniref:tRNA pseudouridine(38/39) synthase isoform X2 n=1 Tax=Dioscorea cayennensis subsp. rotundata TaxID=55577 RepID=A0AB40BDI9_DIOCR|nr:tRNA pseudouridine(38/39) synthase isoform X2 [Dioscorea cayenensis subsp. rotundata]